jgi:hypothetical protein
MSLLELLRAVGKRPGLYIGGLSPNSFSIWHLWSFLSGYQCGGRHHPVLDGDDILDGLTFWVCTRFGVPDGSMNWACHLWRQSGENDEAAFRLFFELLEEYVKDRELLGTETIKVRFMEMLEKQSGKNI